MNNTLSVLLLGLIVPLNAMADTVDPEPNILLDGTTYSFTHNILDEGYNPSTDTIGSALLSMTFEDIPTNFGLGDGIQQTADIYLDGNYVRTISELPGAGGGTFVESFDLGGTGYLDDGLLDVTINSSSGPELFFNMSQLDFTLASEPPPPPVDTTPANLSSTVNPDPNILLDDTSYSFTHNILDEGFNPATDTIDSALLALTFEDIPSNFGLGDGIQQTADIYLDGNYIRTISELAGVGGGTFVESFDLAGTGYLDDGLLDVTINSSAGSELFFNMSQLDVGYSTPTSASVPEPPAWLLLGFVFLLFVGKQRSNIWIGSTNQNL